MIRSVREGKSVKRFERSNGADIALYKNYPYLLNNMKHIKSQGVDGIAPKILKETMEHISMPLAHVFNLSPQEGIVHL